MPLLWAPHFLVKINKPAGATSLLIGHLVIKPHVEAGKSEDKIAVAERLSEKWTFGQEVKLGGLKGLSFSAIKN